MGVERSSRGPRVETSRDAHKGRTRQSLINAALRLVAKNSFDRISLREVTREAHISATAFYRHFDDMEELGMVLVEQAFESLSGMLRQARENPAIFNDVIPQSVEVLVEHVRTHEEHMRFIARERHGGVRRIRRAIAREIDLVTTELALDLAEFPVVGGWTTEDRRLLAQLIVELMVGVAAEMVDTEPSRHAAVARRAERQLRLVVVGAAGWQSTPSASAAARPKA
ncbi:MAG TPA: TetR family transcriptional regulator [Acidimicrobiales bacterium]